MSTKPVEECTTCQDKGLLVCSCQYYDDWTKQKPARPQRQIRHPGRFFVEGHRSARADTCRRLWKHLDPEGRALATAIANEGNDAHD